MTKFITIKALIIVASTAMIVWAVWIIGAPDKWDTARCSGFVATARRSYA